MRIEMWADMLCPWAYIGKRRLEKALADPALAGVRTEVVWRPFRIDPTAPAQATPILSRGNDLPMGAGPGQCVGPPPSRDQTTVTQVAAEEGFGPNWGAAWRSDSHSAHRLVLLAYEHGGSALQDRVVEQLMKAHFLEAADISDPAQLLEVASRSGFTEAGRLLEAGAADREVRELLLIGKARSVTSSPTLVVGDRALAGAQPADVMVDFLTTAADVRARELPEEVLRLRWSESLLEQRDPLGALTLLQPLLGEHAEDLNVRRLAARGYFHSAQLSRAHDVLRQLVEDTPDDSYVHLMLGRTLQRMGRADEAAKHMKVAAAMTPDFT
ncbi:DsbA family protein [Streptomyces sp. 4F14]|uniref:DsbA family protein n=1 Tax=Streptomyces sp. 4F14 TaxID=3394380 RepID=UPI003A855511